VQEWHGIRDMVVRLRARTGQTSGKRRQVKPEGITGIRSQSSGQHQRMELETGAMSGKQDDTQQYLQGDSRAGGYKENSWNFH
jgi:hypothetical protein